MEPKSCYTYAKKDEKGMRCFLRGYRCLLQWLIGRVLLYGLPAVFFAPLSRKNKLLAVCDGSYQFMSIIRQICAHSCIALHGVGWAAWGKC